MQRLLLTLAFVLAMIGLLATLAGAQTLTLEVDKGTVPGLGPPSLLPYELDGNPSTREFIQYTTDPVTLEFLYRSIATSPKLCMSRFYNPYNYAVLRPFDWFVVGQVMRAGDRDKFVYTGQQSYGEVDLMPRCD